MNKVSFPVKDAHGQVRDFLGYLDESGRIVPIQYLEVAGSTLVQQRTESHLAGGIVTFDEAIVFVSIYNRDDTEGVFTVNGVEITVPAGESTRGPIKVGLTPSEAVTVTGSTLFIISSFI